ncbi:hypothetical protein HN51_047438 [Arachis hypogaea]
MPTSKEIWFLNVLVPSIIVPLLLSLLFLNLMPKETAIKSYEMFGVEIEKNPPLSTLIELDDMVMLEQVQDVIGLPVEVVLKYVDNTG